MVDVEAKGALPGLEIFRGWLGPVVVDVEAKGALYTWTLVNM